MLLELGDICEEDAVCAVTHSACIDSVCACSDNYFEVDEVCKIGKEIHFYWSLDNIKQYIYIYKFIENSTFHIVQYFWFYSFFFYHRHQCSMLFW